MCGFNAVEVSQGRPLHVRQVGLIFDVRNIAIAFGVEKLEWWGYPTVKKLWGYV